MNARRLILSSAMLAAFGLATIPAGAERLVTSLSNYRVLVSSNFTGTDLVLFGTVERDAATVARRGGYDVVVTVIGPRQNLVTRRKGRVFGIWVNVESRTFVDAPSYLVVRSNRPLTDITDAALRKRFQIGLDEFVLEQKTKGRAVNIPDDPFRTALVRLEREHGLYRERDNAITLLTPTIFRAAIPLPADVPTGNYEVDVRLFADGAMLARDNTAFEIVKVGVEQFVATAAREHGLLYGLATAMLALIVGWFASVVFRRD